MGPVLVGFLRRPTPAEEEVIMDHHKVAQDLVRDEGMRCKPYEDAVGKVTIGVGRNLDDKGITHAEAAMLLHNDIEECVEHALEVFPAWDTMPEAAQHVVINMIFQLGAAGFRTFKVFIAHIRNCSWLGAAREVMNSKAARQTPARFQRHSDVLRSLGGQDALPPSG